MLCQGDKVYCMINGKSVAGHVCGKASEQPIMGGLYIIEPYESISSKDYPYTHFVMPEVSLTRVQVDCSSVSVKDKNKKVSQKEFNKAFNDLLKGSTQRYLDPETGKVSKKKTSRIEVLDSNDKWLIDYDTAKKNPSFLYSHFRVLLILRKQFSLQDIEVQGLMKSLVEAHFKMKGVTPRDAVYLSPWLRPTSK